MDLGARIWAKTSRSTDHPVTAESELLSFVLLIGQVFAIHRRDTLKLSNGTRRRQCFKMRESETVNSRQPAVAVKTPNLNPDEHRFSG